jgi:hypothetical protein
VSHVHQTPWPPTLVLLKLKSFQGCIRIPFSWSLFLCTTPPWPACLLFTKAVGGTAWAQACQAGQWEASLLLVGRARWAEIGAICWRGRHGEIFFSNSPLPNIVLSTEQAPGKCLLR